MKLYHGSNLRIDEVNLEKSGNFKDFGKGFYLTPSFQRAVKMANRRRDIENEGEPIVNPFIFYRSSCGKDNLKKLAIDLKYHGEDYIQYCFCTQKSLNFLIRD